MSVFRPAFRAIAQSLSDLDLIFVEEAFERLMLDYDRVFSAIHTPACLWRRTGEIYKGNKEMSNLTGIPSQCFRGGNLGIFQLMDEESIVKYYQVCSRAFDTIFSNSPDDVLRSLSSSEVSRLILVSKQDHRCISRGILILNHWLFYDHRHQERQYGLYATYPSPSHQDTSGRQHRHPYACACESSTWSRTNPSFLSVPLQLPNVISATSE
jgi:hypothetical protein